MDPCLDDCIMLAKKLKSLGVTVGIDVLSGLPHGFLSFVKVSRWPLVEYLMGSLTESAMFVHLQLSKEAHDGSRVCIQRLAELIGDASESHC